MATFRGRSRSPLKREHDDNRASPTPSNASVSTNNSSKFSHEKKVYPKGFDMKVSHLPKYWTWKQMSLFIKKHTDPVDTSIGQDIQHIRMINQTNQYRKECIVIFSNPSSRKQAFEILKNTREMVDGQKLFYTILGEDGNPKPNTAKKPFTKTQYQPNFKNINFSGTPNIVNKQLMSSDGEEGSTYGLSMEYLNNLGITLPLTRKIFVTYLNPQYDNEQKVRNLFSLAGNVVSVQLLFKEGFNSARVEFDHPVEAVQAVSLFNGKEINRMPMKIKIDPIRFVMPEGLKEYGNGLGVNGEPMRGVRVAVEVRSLKTDIMNEFQKLNETVDDLRQQVVSLQQKAQQPPPVNQNQNPLAALGNLLQPMQLLQGLVPQNQGNDLTAMLQTLVQNLSNNNWQNPQPGNINPMPAVGLNMQGPNVMPGGIPGPSNMQRGPANNMPGPVNNMQGPRNNMQGPVNNMQGPVNNMQGPGNMQRGPMNNIPPGNLMQGRPNVQPTPANPQQVNPNSFAQGQNNDGFNMPQGPNQQGYSNVQSGFSNPQQSGSNWDKQRNSGYGGSQFNNNPNAHNEGLGSSILLFKNLPPSVYLASLQTKMNEVGDVKLVEMTGQGRAIVNFHSEFDADKCLRLFHQSKVDGQIIEVRKI